AMPLFGVAQELVGEVVNQLELGEEGRCSSVVEHVGRLVENEEPPGVGLEHLAERAQLLDSVGHAAPEELVDDEHRRDEIDLALERRLFRRELPSVAL